MDKEHRWKHFPVGLGLSSCCVLSDGFHEDFFDLWRVIMASIWHTYIDALFSFLFLFFFLLLPFFPFYLFLGIYESA